MSSSQLLLRLPRWVLVRMATRSSRAKECHGCGRWRPRFFALLVLSCVLGSLWVVCKVEDCGFWWRKDEGGAVEVVEKSKSPVATEQLNLSKGQLQALFFLLSTMGQKPFSECLDKSVTDKPVRDSISQAILVVCSRWEHLRSQQEWMRYNTNFHDQCPVLDGYISEKLKKSSDIDGNKSDTVPQYITPLDNDAILLKESEDPLHPRGLLKSKEAHLEILHKLLGEIFWLALLGAIGLLCKGSALCRMMWMPSAQQVLQQKQKQQQQDSQPQNSKGFGRWRKKLLFLGVSMGFMVSVWLFLSMNASIISRRKENLATMCDERARMLQDQFNVSMNHVHALAILVSTFHHGKHPSAIDQKTFAEYTARTSFERPLISGVAYALKVPHSQREEFEKEHGWRIKKMETEDQSPVQDDYITEKLDPSPVQNEYAPVIFSQETVSHIVSIDMMSGKEDRENILRARASGKGVLTSPFNLLKSKHLGVVLTFAVYNTELAPDSKPEERIEATVGYLGASFDVPSLVERLLQQLASKQTIIVNVYDTTNSSAPIRMYGPETTDVGDVHVSNLDFGDPIRRHKMHCRFKHEPPPPWSAITAALGVAVIVLLVGHIFHAAINRIEKVEDDYREMRELKVRAEAADVAKSQFLATVSHEIRTPMNGVLGMLQMLMDTNLDATQQDFAMTAQSSGKALITLINEVLDQAKIESGRLELEAVPFDVRDVLDVVLSLFSDKSQAKGIELAAYVSEHVPEVLIGDPGRFRQIITNLVGNSVKFTEKGHIFVSVHLVEEVKSMHEVSDTKQNSRAAENGTEMSYDRTLSGCPVVDRWRSWEKFKLLDVSAEDSDVVNILVTVEDTGVGIPYDAQSRIFMPFMQADSSTSRTYGGTGIGLSISKCLVDLMGGEIGFVSKPRIGSTFSFTAVFRGGRKNGVDLKRHQPEQDVSDFLGMRGLIVDGRGIRAEVAKYHLQRLGIQVHVANKNQSAISCILDACNSRTWNMDMVLVDKEAWGEGSGLEFPHSLRQLQQNESLKIPENLPKLFLLATSLSPTEVDEVKAAGYVDSMIKPLRLSMMVACLRRSLGVGNQRCQEKRQPMALNTLLREKQILVVDDNVVNRKVAEGALKKYGAVVTCAGSGKVAIELLRPPHKFDACFMDVQMPEMDGFEATKQIRYMESKVNDLLSSGEASTEMYGNRDRWHIPILAMTADVFQATHDECIRCGMDGYVSKPFEEEQLYSAVAHFFEVDTESLTDC